MSIDATDAEVGPMAAEAAVEAAAAAVTAVAFEMRTSRGLSVVVVVLVTPTDGAVR